MATTATSVTITLTLPHYRRSSLLVPLSSHPELFSLSPPAPPSALALTIRASSPKTRSIAAVADSEAAPPALTSDPQELKDIDLEGDTGGSGAAGGAGGEGFGRGGGGGGDDGSGRGGDRGEGEGPPEEGRSKKMGGMMSMSQKLTLGYAALVGAGGVIGYIKSGSQKSLAAGGSSALLLYYVYTQLPARPAFASSLGLGLSAALLVVMGSRYKKSRKMLPAGVVSLVSLIMVGGYFHGIMRTLHA